MTTVKINVSGPVAVGAKVCVIGGPWEGLTGTVARSDLLRCGVVGMWKGHEVKARVRLDHVLRVQPKSAAEALAPDNSGPRRTAAAAASRITTVGPAARSNLVNNGSA